MTNKKELTRAGVTELSEEELEEAQGGSSRGETSSGGISRKKATTPGTKVVATAGGGSGI